ncbi:MAG: winged helix-turn-helix transcriptional regulator [Firmicutes bacterium]|jgi:ArsR family transcriptional regulator|nr:winged helix-turn-helix transcriptional regulator [Bacillota bacterium]
MGVVQLVPIGLTFKALSDPNRRKILQLLKRGDLTAGELAEHFEISKPSLSHHLSVLKQAGLVSDERQGQNIIYSLESTVFQDIIAWLMEYTGDEKGISPKEGGAADE